MVAPAAAAGGALASEGATALAGEAGDVARAGADAVEAASDSKGLNWALILFALAMAYYMFRATNTATEAVDEGTEGVGDAGRAVGDTVGDAYDGTQDIVDDAYDGTQDVVDDTIGGTQDAVDDTVDYVAGGGQDIVEGIGETFGLV